MSPIVTIALPAFILGLAYTLARRELKLYRVAGELGSGLFVYSRGRLVRRLTGIAILVALGLTFAALGIIPPRSAGAANAYLAAILGELGALFVLPIWDLVETARTGRRRDRVAPDAGEVTREAAPPRKRNRRRRPR